MSIIQTIRDKYAKWTVVVIALAIIGFLLMDASVGRSRLLSGGGGKAVGSVNGKSIGYEEFAKKVDNAEQNIESQQKGIAPETKRGQAIDAVWNQEVNNIIMDAEYEKLGLVISENEVADMIAGERPSQIAQQYLAQQDQPYNGAQALQLVNQIKRSNRADDKQRLADLLDYMKRTRLDEKFNALFTNSLNVPRWIIEAQNADNSRIANASFISIPYNDTALFPHDTTLKVSDEEILAYVNKNKKQFKQTESRSINYAAFSFAPSAADTLQAKERVLTLSNAFRDAADTKMFLDREGTDMPYFDNFILASSMQQAAKDSILNTPVGGLYGAYLDGSQFVVSKMVDSRMIPDSVTVRHILIATAQQDPQTREFTPTRDTTIARKMINDSVIALLNSGISFDSVCKKISEDPGSKERGGLYENVKWGGMVPSFNEFIFTHGPGSKGTVYTDFGFHYIEVLSHMGIADERIVKVGFLSRTIETSQATDDAASTKANSFAGKIKNQKEFDELFDKELKPAGMNKGVLPNITPATYTVGVLGDSREFIKKIYAAKKGEIIKPEKVGANYVVAVVTDVLEEGTQDAATARPMVEPTLRNKLKAEIIRKKVGKITTLEAAAALLNKNVETVDSVSVGNPRTFPYEQRMFGACFNPANKGKIVTDIIEGNRGVYLLQVNSTATAPLANANITELRASQVSQRKNMAQYRPVSAALKEAATIKDKRVKNF